MKTSFSGRVLAICLIITAAGLVAGLTGTALHAEATEDTECIIKVVDLTEDDIDIQIETIADEIENIANIKEIVDSALEAVDLEHGTCSIKFMKTDEDDGNLIHVFNNDISNNTQITMKDGKIVSVTKDGEEVPESEFDQYKDTLAEVQELVESSVDAVDLDGILDLEGIVDLDGILDLAGIVDLDSMDDAEVIKKVICIKKDDSQDE